jgi:hypothetical protein
MWGYIEFAGHLTGVIAGGGGGPSATRMGSKVSSFVEDKALTKITGMDKDERTKFMRKAGSEVSKAVKDGIKEGKMPDKEKLSEMKDNLTKGDEETTDQSNKDNADNKSGAAKKGPSNNTNGNGGAK